MRTLRALSLLLVLSAASLRADLATATAHADLRALSLLLVLSASSLRAADLATATAHADRDMLLTTDATLFTVERVTIPSSNGESLPAYHLRLKMQQGAAVKSSIVPTTDGGGVPSAPSLTYDPGSKTLFLFWQKQPNQLGSELLLCSYRNGEWGPVTSIESSAFHYRFNLRIGVTRLVHVEEKDKAPTRVSGLSVHVIWWDTDAYGESARYAMISFDQGRVLSIEIRDLLDFVPGQATAEPGAVIPESDKNFLRYPGIFEAPTQDSVDIVFSDWNKNRIHRINVRPTIQDKGYIRLPVGRHERRFDVPTKFDAPARVTIVPGSSPEKLLFYSQTDQGLRWVSHNEKGWSEPKTFKLDDLSADRGAELLRKMISAE